MKVRCSHCNVAYAVDDAKVTGKKFAFDCPKCGNNVVVDNRVRVQSVVPEIPKQAVSVPEESFLAEPMGQTALDAGLDAETSFDFSAADVAGKEVATQEEEPGFDEFEDELEPEIDLSVLQNLASPETKNAASDDDLLSSDFSSDIIEEDLSFAGHTAPVEDITGNAGEEDESLTIDLNSLDIDLAEPEEVSAGESSDQMLMSDLGESERLSLPVEELEVESAAAARVEDEDESLTLDLDSLDIPLEESSEFKEGETLEEDTSRLSLGDAGLSVDDVESSEGVIPFEEEVTADLETPVPSFDEEEKPFSDESIISDIDQFISEERPLSDEFNGEELPEVDIERFEGSVIREESDFERIPSAPAEDQFLDIEAQKKYDQYEEDLNRYDADTVAASGGGYVNFSIDYSFHYSRIRALLRLILVYYITFIPYFVIGFIYSLISGVVGTLNQILVLFSGKRERDFSLMQEQTLRFMVSLYASVLNVIEDKPPFGGKSDIDHQLQFRIVYPPEFSRILAFLRLSIVGITLLVLPHLILLLVMTIGMSLIAVVSLFYAIFTGRWPSLLFDFMVRYLRYWTTINAYVCGLIDTYPSFRFE